MRRGIGGRPPLRRFLLAGRLGQCPLLGLAGELALLFGDFFLRLQVPRFLPRRLEKR